MSKHPIVELGLVYWSDRLDQASYWVSADLTVHKVSEMDHDHLLNTRAWLIRNAGRIHSTEARQMMAWASMFNGEMAQMEADRACDQFFDLNPTRWVKESILYRGMRDQLGRRARMVPTGEAALSW